MQLKKAFTKEVNNLIDPPLSMNDFERRLKNCIQKDN